MSDASYDSIAGWYDRYLVTNPIYREAVVPGVLQLTTQLAGAAILDIACGQGLISRELAQRGATVTGVDVSSKLLEIAQRYEEEEPLGINYLIADAQTLEPFDDASFDGATCAMALMNIEDIEAAAHAIQRVLKPGGWFVAAITHPCYQTPEARWVDTRQGPSRQVRAYFDERYWESPSPSGVRGQIGEHHRMLSTYINTFSAAGLLCQQLAEPYPGPDLAQQTPGSLQTPSILALRFTKLS